MGEERLPAVFHGRMFAVIDDGTASADDYRAIERLVAERATRLGKLGCIAVIPQGPKIPSEDQRRVIDGTLSRLAPHLAGLAWVVEERGFQGAAVRGVLTALSLYGGRPYPTHVSSTVEGALGWLGGKLAPEGVDVPASSLRISRARAAYGSR
jgi:hypothetical protein